MTTAFELGCLSAMEKVAVNSGAKDPAGNRRTSAENRTSRELRGLIPAAQPEAQKPVQDLSYTPIGPAGAAASRATADPKLNAATIPRNSLFPVSPEARAELERQAAMIAARQGQNNLLPYVPGTGKADDGFFSGIGSGLYNAAMGTGNFIGNAASTAYNVASEVPSVAGGYLNAAGNGLNYAGNAIGDTVGLGYGPAIPSNKHSVLMSPAPSKALIAAHGLKSIRREIADHDAKVKQRIEGTPVLRPSERHLAGPGLDSETAAKAAPESTSESTPEPTSEPQAQGGLASYLKNPYVLGGLGIGALGLGGYGLYNHFNSKKKKKKKSDSE
jgi:hypothetical protein